MIDLQAICRDYDVGEEVVHALDHVDLSIESGEYISIMGPSGSGKSTLLNILGLLDRPTSGEYLLDGESIAVLEDDELAAVRREKIGFIFQSFHLVPRLSAAENVELPMMLKGDPPRSRREAAREMLESVGLDHRLDHRPDQLSGGERQRVACARALVNEPSILLADEPTGNLDSATGDRIMTFLQRVVDERRQTVLMVTHDARFAAMAHRVVKLRDGRVCDE